MTIAHALAWRPREGESVCGDAIWVIDGPVACVLVVDGLGHGAQAAAAAQALVEFVKSRWAEPPVQTLTAASSALAGTRGAVGLIAQFSAGDATLRVAGVGNIEVRAASSYPIAPVCTPGIIGRPVRRVQEFVYRLTRGDRLLIATDGISRRVELGAYRALSLEDTVQRVLAEHGKQQDDAACVVVEYCGGAA